MPPRTSAAYSDCEKVFDQALAEEKGIQIVFDTAAAAIAFRARMHTFRSQVRRESRKTYGHVPDDPRYDRSPYDHFTIRIVDTGTVKIEKEPEITGKISAL